MQQLLQLGAVPVRAHARGQSFALSTSPGLLGDVVSLMCPNPGLRWRYLPVCSPYILATDPHHLQRAERATSRAATRAQPSCCSCCWPAWSSRHPTWRTCSAALTLTLVGWGG